MDVIQLEADGAAPAEGSTRIRFATPPGGFPGGWVVFELGFSRPDGQSLLPRLFADDGVAVHELATTLLLPSDGGLRGVLRLPDQVAALFLEPGVAAGQYTLGAVRVRALSRLEATVRLGARVLRRPGKLARAVLVERSVAAVKRCLREEALPPRPHAPPEEIARVRARKLEKLRPLLRPDLPHEWRGDKADYLTSELRRQFNIVDTDNVSANPYDRHSLELIEACRDGLVLDCGAGKRDRYFENVVNLEIADYDSTDVLGVGEVLPFRDASFDAVLSLAVLEHVREPFRCAAEIVRVLKPGGKLICCVPFLQPLHGYPHHYYNMTHQGLGALFDRSLRIDQQLVIDSILPIHSLTWIVQSWARGLPAGVREQFLDLPLRAFMSSAEGMLQAPFVRALPEEKNFELASGTMLFATKP